MKILAIALAIFALYLPIAMFVHRNYVQAPRPAGSAIEMMLKFGIDEPDRYVARSYVFDPLKYPDASQIRVYENMTPIPSGDTEFTADGLAYVIRFRTSDGTDARNNGRQYWIVAPPLISFGG